MTNPTTDLEHVLELVEKATPGPWRVSGTSHLCDAKRHVIHAVGDDGEAIGAAVNFLREHGRTLLEAMRDAERYRWLRGRLQLSVRREAGYWAMDADGCRYPPADSLDAAVDRVRLGA